MDDIVHLSTSKSGMIRNIRLLNDFCVAHRMDVNVRKIKFMVLNGEDVDKENMIVDDVTVEPGNWYIYTSTSVTRSRLTALHP